MELAEYIESYLEQTKRVADAVDRAEIKKCVEILRGVREAEGRLFILGVGGSAANASHAVNDFRKIGRIEAYAPTDNVSELTARTNDEGFETVFTEYLRTSRLRKGDALLVLSVGGGGATTSRNIADAVALAKQVGAKVLAIVSRDGGAAKQAADACVLIPVVDGARITPHAEGWQGVIWHLIVNAL